MRPSSRVLNMKHFYSTAKTQQQSQNAGMMRFEADLPKLPVNTLVETSARWLESVRPIVSDPGQPLVTSDQPNEAFLRAQQVAEDFVASPLVRELQNRLKERASQKDSWISDWWNEAAYFGPRDPLAYVGSKSLSVCTYLTSNRSTTFTHTKMILGASGNLVPRTQLILPVRRRNQALRAAGLVRALLAFRRLVETHVLEPEMVR